MLSILRQPEEKHRARYISEGSRGAIKDRSGLAFTTVQLVGHDSPAVLQVFAATPSGALRPHPYYKLIKVVGKGVGEVEMAGGRAGRGCRETERDRVPCLEFQLSPKDNMTAVLDCVGILKICSGEVRSLTGMKWAKGSIRLALSVSLPNKKVTALTSPIFCGQQLGKPELKRLIPSSVIVGGKENAVTLVGRNLDKNTRVHFYLPGPDGEAPVWSVEAEIHRDYHTCQFHIICVIPCPELKGAEGRTEVEVEAVCGDKVSNSLPFTFLHHPHPIQAVKQEMREEVEKKVGITRSTSPVQSVFSHPSTPAPPLEMGSSKLRSASLDYRNRNVSFWPLLQPRPASPSSVSPFGGSSLSGSSFSSGTSGIPRLEERIIIPNIPTDLIPSQLALENKRLYIQSVLEQCGSLPALRQYRLPEEVRRNSLLPTHNAGTYLDAMNFESSFGTLSLPTRPALFGGGHSLLLP